MRISVIVGRIIARPLQWFRENFSDIVIPHIVITDTAQSRNRSVLMN